MGDVYIFVTRPGAVKDVPVLMTGDVQVGTVRPSHYGNDEVVFKGLRLDAVTTLVLPYLFKEGNGVPTTITIVPRNFQPTGPFVKNGTITVDYAHRVFPNPEEEGLDQINVGIMIPIEVTLAECNRVRQASLQNRS